MTAKETHGKGPSLSCGIPLLINLDRYFCVETDDNGRPLERTAKRKILPKVMRDNFSRKSLLCCEYKDLSETQEREIFQRVQLGIPLTKAEAFRATMGVWQDFAELYEHDFPKVVNRKWSPLIVSGL